MHPVLSIGIYLLVQLIVLILAGRILRDAGIWPMDMKKASGSARNSSRGLRILFGILLALLVLLPVGGAMLPDSFLKFRIQAWGNIWIGFTVYFSGIFLILMFLQGLVLLVCGLVRKRTPKAERTRTWNGKGALAILLFSFIASLILLIYGMLHAQKTVLKEYAIAAAQTNDETGEAAAPGELKIVLIADLHLSVNSHLPMIETMVEMINAQQPDVVLFAGDLFTSSYGGLSHPQAYAAVLRQIESKYGVYAVYGNHDVEETLFGGFPIAPISEAFRSPQMEQFFKDCNFTVLEDEIVTIADASVCIAGRIDGEKAGDGTTNRMTPSELLSKADKDPDRVMIVLQHEPVEFQALKDVGADLVVCGHTHNGQMFPGNLIVPYFNENAYGYKNADGMHTIVTAGVGYYGPPMRIGTNSEVTVIRLKY